MFCPDCEVDWTLQPREKQEESRCWICGKVGLGGSARSLLAVRREIANPVSIAHDYDQRQPLR